MAPHNSIGRDDTIKTVRERHHRLSVNRKKGSIAGQVKRSNDGMVCTPAIVPAAAEGKPDPVAEEDMNGAVKAPTKTVVARPAIEATPRTAAAPKPMKEMPARGGVFHVWIKGPSGLQFCTVKLCSRCHGRGKTAALCPTANGNAVLAVMRQVGEGLDIVSDDSDDDALQVSAFKTEETVKCDGAVRKMGGGELAWQVGDEAWIFDSGASTHMTPSLTR